MDALLKALFSQFDSSLDPFSDADPAQVIAAQFGRMGGPAGAPYGLWGSMFGDVVPQMQVSSPIKAFTKDDPLLAAIISE